MKNESQQFEGDGQQFIMIGYTLFLTMIIKEGVYFVWTVWMNLFGPRFATSSGSLALVLGIISYGLAFLFFLRRMKKIPEAPKDSPKKLTFKEMTGLITISIGTAYLFGNANGVINQLIYSITFISPDQEMGAYSSIGMLLSNLPSILFLGVLAPIIYEIIFRGVILDKLRGYGEWRVIVFTALTFTLFQGNLSDFLSTFSLGLIYGYVAFRTGTIRYTIILHIVQNLFVLFFIPALGLLPNETGMILQVLIPLIIVVVSGVLFVKNFNKVNLPLKKKNLIKRQVKKLFTGIVGCSFTIWLV